jgi:hypothetical protein
MSQFIPVVILAAGALAYLAMTGIWPFGGRADNGKKPLKAGAGSGVPVDDLPRRRKAEFGRR